MDANITMITPNHSKLYKQLDSSKINKVQIVKTPVVKITLAGEVSTSEFGGELAIVHYNRDKEIQHRINKNNKRFRTLRKQEKQAHCCTVGDSFPNVSRLNKAGELTG